MRSIQLRDRRILKTVASLGGMVRGESKNSTDIILGSGLSINEAKVTREST